MKEQKKKQKKNFDISETGGGPLNFILHSIHFFKEKHVLQKEQRTFEYTLLKRILNND
jgi:hypothetical protein